MRYSRFRIYDFSLVNTSRKLKNVLDVVSKYYKVGTSRMISKTKPANGRIEIVHAFIKALHYYSSLLKPVAQLI